MISASIGASVMILIIMLLRLFLLKHLPKRCFRLLWILAALRFLIPFSFILEIEVEVPSSENIMQPVYIDTSDVIYSGEYAEAEASNFDYTVIIKSVFVLGTIISGGFLISAYVRMRKIALRADLICEEYTQCILGADVRAGNGASTPFSCGVLRPVIFIPSQMLVLDDEQLDMIITHEMRHIKCADQLVKWLIAAAVCLNWYNPLAWVMWKLANLDIELACDEAVVSSGTDSYDYALCLIAVQEVRLTGAVCSFGAPVLNERIKFIMKSKKITIGGFIAAGLLLAMMTVFFVSVTAVESDNKPENTVKYEGKTELSDDMASAEIQEKEDVYANTEAQTNEQLPICIETDELKSHPIELEMEVDERTNEVVYEVTTVECLNEEPTADEPHEVGSSEDVEYITYVEYAECIEDESLSNISYVLVGYDEITSHFGEQTSPTGAVTFNNGVNVAAAKGTAVYAAAGGNVVNCGYDYSMGNFIEINHGRGWITIYSHLEKILVTLGDEVESGEKIGTVGQTGCATGPNLGFSLIHNGSYLSPEDLFIKGGSYIWSEG